MYKSNLISKKTTRWCVTFIHLTLRIPLGIMVGGSMLFQIILGYPYDNFVLALLIGVLTIVNVVQYGYLHLRKFQTELVKS